jgi:hypothetical protein
MTTIMISSSLRYAAAVASRGEIATRKGATELFTSPAFLALTVRSGSSSTPHDSSSSSSSSSNYITLANPAPGSPFHYAFPVHSLEAAKEFHDLADRLRTANVQFIIEPHLRFVNMPGEQWTMFFKDPSGNNLEFKAMTKMENLFAKYNVD